MPTAMRARHGDRVGPLKVTVARPAAGQEQEQVEVRLCEPVADGDVLVDRFCDCL